MRKLQNGSYTESYFEPIDLTIHTKAPGKWKLIDMETGQEYIGSAKPNQYGMWIRTKDKEISESGYSTEKWSDDGDWNVPITPFRDKLK